MVPGKDIGTRCIIFEGNWMVWIVCFAGPQKCHFDVEGVWKPRVLLIGL